MTAPMDQPDVPGFAGHITDLLDLIEDQNVKLTRSELMSRAQTARTALAALMSTSSVVDITDDDSFMDFTSLAKPPRFKVDGDVFEGQRDIPVFTALEFSAKQEELKKPGSSNLDKMRVFGDIFRLTLQPSSAERIIARMSDPNNPIGMSHITKIMPWLMGRYAQRPTQPPSSSSTGSDVHDGGTTSTDVASHEESISDS